MVAESTVLLSILALLAPALAATVALLGVLYRWERERRLGIERQLSEHKSRAYITLMEIFFDLMKGVRAGKPIPEKKLIGRMIDANKELVLYGSDEVVQIYQDWLEKSRKGEQLAGLTWFGDLIIAIRRDMGHSKTKITSDDVLRQFITDYDEAKLKELVEKGTDEET